MQQDSALKDASLLRAITNGSKVEKIVTSKYINFDLLHQELDAIAVSGKYIAYIY